MGLCYELWSCEFGSFSLRIFGFFFFFNCEETKAPKKSKEAVLKDWSKKSNVKAERVNYSAEFMVDSNFGVPGAITVTNKHQKEFFLESITIEGFACGPVHFPCNSWVQSRKDHPAKRIFFSNMVNTSKSRHQLQYNYSCRLNDLTDALIW